MSLKLKYNITSWSEFKLNYWGITKVGNTSMKYALQQHDIEHDNHDDANAWIHKEDLATYIDKQTALTNGYTNFSIIRDPYDRFYSLYDDFMNKRHGMLGVRDMSFEDFAEYVSKTDDSFSTNVHIRSQFSFLSLNNKLVVGCLLNLNNIPAIENFVKTHSEIDINFPHLHSGVDTKVEWTDNIRELIKKRYEKDFELVSYGQ